MANDILFLMDSSFRFITKFKIMGSVCRGIFLLVALFGFIFGITAQTEISGSIRYHGADALQDNPALKIGENGGVQHVLVSISGMVYGRTSPSSSPPAQMEVHAQTTIPRIIVLQMGRTPATLTLKNPTDEVQQIHGIPKVNRMFNFSLNPGESRTLSFTRPEAPFPLKNGQTKRTIGYVAVMVHPFFAISDSGGKYTIPNLPPGKYAIRTWHEKLGSRVQEIEFSEGVHPAPLDFTYE